jgi:hypothetical protein
MNSVSNAVAILFPGVNTTDVVNASIAHEAHILIKEQYSESKDYTKFFRRSKRIVSTDQMNLLFIFSDGSSNMVKDMDSLKKTLKKASLATGAFA